MKKNRVTGKFLEELKKVPIIQVACERVGISRQSVYRWRATDPHFVESMDAAMLEGENLVNDIAESNILTLIKEKNLPAIRLWLSTHHPRYGAKREEKIIEDLNSQRVIEEMGLTPEDFDDDKLEETIARIAKYLLENDI